MLQDLWAQRATLVVQAVGTFLRSIFPRLKPGATL